MKTKPFNIDQARAGHPVCTRDLRPVRILCYDRSDGYDKDNIVALVKETDDCEFPRVYNSDGSLVGLSGETTKDDLMLATTKKSGWIRLYKDRLTDTVSPDVYIFDTEEEAKRHDNCGSSEELIDTVQITWEE